MIELKNLSKIYKTKDKTIVAVDNINLTIQEGEIFGVVGYSGAGKSSLIRLFNQLEKPSSGEIKIDGFDIAALSGKALRQARQSIGMVFQHFNLLWSRTVQENISFSLEIAAVPKAQRQARVQELINLVGLEGRENAYPSQLSGGQKQRVGIARALANNPKLLLCDEATSALDPQTTDSILELLLDINKRLNLTIVLITHEMHVVRKICDRMAVMENGKVVEQGEVAELFQRPQQNITKRFVAQLSEFTEDSGGVEHLLSQISYGALLRLSFVGPNTLTPLISDVVQKFAVEVSILQGKIVNTPKGALGSLFIYVKADVPLVEQIIDFIRQQAVEVEVIKHV